MMTRTVARALAGSALFLIILFVAWLGYALRPVATGGAEPQRVEVASGDGMREIGDILYSRGLIRSAGAFRIYAVLNGSARDLKPGLYDISPSYSTRDIVTMLVRGARVEVSVTIVEGSTVYDVARALVMAGIIAGRDLPAYAEDHDLEGTLFPDTYFFYRDAALAEIVERMTATYEEKTRGLFEPLDQAARRRALIIGSILEKEVPEFHDRRVVAGLLERRLAAKMPLQVDASVCYVKQVSKSRQILEDFSCYPLDNLDFKIDSPYNTYVYRGLPPGPIGNPGIKALEAALSPIESPYWYYLSDPATGKTIFSKTLQEHNKNRERYLF
jgi:UPF0755 protein